MTVSLKLKNDVSVIEPTVDFVYKFGINAGLSEKESSELALAFDEVITDIILFAFEPYEEKEFTISLNKTLSEVEIIIHELGEPFDIERHRYSPEKAKTEFNFDGAGILLSKSLLDDFIYLFKGREGKEFRLVKKIKHSHITEIYKETELKKEPEKAVEYTIAPVTEKDAEDIARLIYRSYGYTYPKEEMYYPKKIEQALKEGKKFGVIVRTEKGEAVGYFAVLRTTDSNIGEVGEVVVSPMHRGKGIMKMMMKALIDMAKTKGLLGLFGEAVTVHTVSQKVNAKYGFKSTAIVLNFFPPAKYKGFEHKENRVSVVIDFLPLKEREEVSIHIPKTYRNIIKEIYKNSGIQVNSIRSRNILPSREKSSLTLWINYKFGSSVIVVRKFGKDFLERVKNKVSSLGKKGIKSVYIDLPFDEPEIKYFVPELRKLGFIFSGVMPLFHKNKDFLRMQLLFDEFDFKYIHLFSDMAKKIKRRILRDLK